MVVIMSKPDRKLRQLLSSYLVAGLSVGLAVVFTLLSGSAIKDATAFFFCSVMLTSWYGGVLARGRSGLVFPPAFGHYFISPLFGFGGRPGDAADMISLVGTAF